MIDHILVLSACVFIGFMVYRVQLEMQIKVEELAYLKMANAAQKVVQKERFTQSPVSPRNLCLQSS